MIEDANYKGHRFEGPRKELNQEAIESYPFWDQAKRQFFCYQLRVFEVVFQPTFLDDVPQNKDDQTRTPQGHRYDRVYTVGFGGQVESLPTSPEYSRIYRVRMSAYDDDVPDDEFRTGQPLKETFQRHAIPLASISYLLWHSEGRFLSSYHHQGSSQQWNTLEVVPIPHLIDKDH